MDRLVGGRRCVDHDGLTIGGEALPGKSPDFQFEMTNRSLALRLGDEMP